ncbi:vWA domain-containing protein [Aestuariimicrobium ganziense]|uniref:vWA domain-containing protein n=1 Tax=Aestuariimicrobium ganziense TaxID=2773677 RepID=UPI001940D941|nr:VWA domain-containing protein [Aestuariimicrobium ganziense]
MSRPSNARYGRYRDGPDPLAPPVDLAEALDAISEDVMTGYSPERALQEFLRRGGRQQRGLDDLAGDVARRRRQLTRRHRLDGTLQEVKELLDRAVLAERKRLARDLDDEARFSEMQLQTLPRSTASAVSQLSSYDWRDAEARENFEQIRDLLGREALDQRFSGMKQALEGATDADREAVKQMLDDLNDLLEAHARGDDTTQQFEQFMDTYGQYFPENPRNVDELLDALAQRAAAAQRMFNSMSADQRRELMELSQQAFGSPALAESMGRLDANLRAMRPGEDWSGSSQFSGEQGLGLGDGTGVLQELADLDDLAEQLGQSYPGARLDDLDLDKLAAHLGDEAAVDARTLTQLEKALRDSGYLRRSTDGSLRLSPKAMRRLGKALLKDAATRLSSRQGHRDARLAGVAGEPSGASRAWTFGDTEPWDVTRTLTNALQRGAGETRRPGEPVRIDIRDVEVTETEARTRAAVVLLVDTSFSMATEGRWVPMKRTALALHHLVSTRFRGDSLQLVGFGRHARAMDIEQLTALEPHYEQGTNLHHALLLAGRHLRRHPSSQPVLLVVTDGEPTAHLMGDGEAFFDYPPHPLSLSLTVTELDAVTRLGAQTTFFQLGDDPGLARFVEQMARRAGGSVVHPDLDDLGAAVVGSYLGSRWGWERDDDLW